MCGVRAAQSKLLTCIKSTALFLCSVSWKEGGKKKKEKKEKKKKKKKTQ